MELMPSFRFHRPTSLAEAVGALTLDPHARLMAGGTDLLPNLRRFLARPGLLVDLTAVEGFGSIQKMADGGLRIGAGLTLDALIENDYVAADWPVLREAALTVAGPTHRVAATVGGNLCQDTRCMFFNQSEWWRASNGYCLKHDGDRCHVVVKNDRCFATYRGDLAPALMVLDAEAEVIGPEGVRRLKVAELFCDSGANHLNLHAGEILVAVIVPAAEGWCAGYDKVRVRAAIDFPIAGVAAAICRRGSRLCALRVAITGCNSAPVQISTAEFDETDWDTATAEAVATAVRKSAEFRRTSNVSAKYRRHVLHAITVRLVERLWMQGSSLTVR